MSEYRASVRELVAFCHRTGDIDHRFTPSPSGAEGVAGHQQLYRRRGSSYRSEYPVEYLHSGCGVDIRLRGRADGYDDSVGFVEEIKTCRIDPAVIPSAVSRLHLAQARVYAALIAKERDLDGLDVRLTWYNIDTDEETPLTQCYSRAELDAFLADALERFSAWIARLEKQRRCRDEGLQSLAFPYGEFRPGQREIAELVYKCVDQGGELLLEAPTGIGKTAAVLYPSLKALAAGKHDRIAYVTAKTVGKRTAEETLDRFRETGLTLSALSLTARERICFSPGKACHGDDCRFARGYYDRLPEALSAAMQTPTLQQSDIEELARRFDICPYQLALDLLPWVDLVIADLHYVYSLGSTLGERMQQDGKRWTVLLDEAHNLPERARRMYRASFAKVDLMALRRQSAGPLLRALNRINRALLHLQNEQWQQPGHDSREHIPERLQRALAEFAADVGTLLARSPTLLHRQPSLLDFYFQVLQFLRLAEHWGDEFRFELERGEGRQGLVVTLNCLVPARLLQERQQRLHSMTAFSATLSPPDWTRRALGMAEEAVFRREASPFVDDQLQVFLATAVDTRYQHRQRTLPLLASMLMQWLSVEHGNCLVYFPSYRYLHDALAALRELGFDQLGRRLWVQEKEQTDEGRDTLLQLLSDRRDVVALCILGGVFGEGIDLPGDKLTGVVIVGVGMPQYNKDTEQLREWYQRQHGAGFDYAYLYPGMQKVDQALGRVIRGSGDRGRALLVDSRYAQRQYRDLLPPWWRYAPWPAADAAR